MSYCSQANVEDHLQPHMSELVAAEAFGGAQAVQARIRALLPATKKAIDWLADRDFGYHADATVTLDGPGDTDTLFLCDLGVKPIEWVSSVVENGEALDGDDYVVYASEGLLRKCAVIGYGSGREWGEGVRNIVVTLSYGYSDIRQQLPEIPQAQAMLTAAAVLAELARVYPDGHAEIKRFGTLHVSYGTENTHADTIRSWLAQARETAARFRRTALSHAV